MFQSLPVERVRRWELLNEFFSRWFSPLSPGDGFEPEELHVAERRLGFLLPSALREWKKPGGPSQRRLVAPR
jgi:hypothetical protein